MPQDFAAAQVLTAAQMDTLSGAVDGYATTATAAGTTTLTTASMYQQFFTGATTQTVTMPVVTTLYLGQKWRVTNNSSGIVTVQSSGANAIYAIPAGGDVIFTCILITGTTAASWDYKDYIQPASAFVGCSIYKSALQTLTAATITAITFNTENFDTNTFHDNATNNSRVTIPASYGGKYLVNFSARSETTDQFTAYIYKNGSAVALGTTGGRIHGVNNSGGQTINTSGSFILSLVATDYIELMLEVSGGVNKDLSTCVLNVQYSGA